MAERVQKVLARAGHGSRREIEGWIRAGRVSINGKVAQLGASVEAQDAIALDGKPLKAQSASEIPRRVLAYHKPYGEVCARTDADGRATVFDRLPRLSVGRWVNVGRLDVTTLGLLLFTTDGELAHRLMHPSAGIEREYAVRIKGEVDAAMLARLREGVVLEDGHAHFETIVDAGGEGSNHWYHVTLREGRRREVRRLWESQGVMVSRLIRVRYGPIRLHRELRPGTSRELSEGEINQLLEAASMPIPQPATSPSRTRRDTRRPGNKPRRSVRR